MKILIVFLLLTLAACGSKGGAPTPTVNSTPRDGIWVYDDGVEAMILHFYSSGSYDVCYVSGNYINCNSGRYSDDGKTIMAYRAADECDDAEASSIAYRETDGVLSLKLDNIWMLMEKVDIMPVLSGFIEACF